MAKKRTWFVVLWASVRNPSRFEYRTIDATLEDATSRVRTILHNDPSFVPDASILNVGHLRGMVATETNSPDRHYASSDCTKPENVLETIPMTAEMVGFHDLRKEKVDFPGLLNTPMRVWVGQIDTKSSVVACDEGVIVIPHAALVEMESEKKFETQDDLFKALANRCRLRLPASPSLRDDRLYPAVQVKAVGFSEPGESVQMIEFRSPGWGNRRNDVVGDLSKTMYRDDTRSAIVLRPVSAAAEPQAEQA